MRLDGFPEWPLVQWPEHYVALTVNQSHVVGDMLLYSQSCTPYFIESIDTHKWDMHGQSFSKLLFVDAIRKDCFATLT